MLPEASTDDSPAGEIARRRAIVGAMLQRESQVHLTDTVKALVGLARGLGDGR